MDEKFLRIAIDLAKQARQNNEYPFGAVLVFEDAVMHSGHDRSVGLCDPTAHAELQVIREYCQSNRRMSLAGYTLYCSTEPCVMCSGAIHWARLSRVVYSVSQEMLQQASAGRIKPKAEALINIGSKKVEVVGPLLPEEGFAVLADYPFTAKAQRATRLSDELDA
jgi:tRNA(Arg) A34 adenosine deaminase TadA